MPWLVPTFPRLIATSPMVGCDPLRLNEDEFRVWLAHVPDNRGFWRAIGGTDVGPILGLSNYQSTQNVWDKLLCQCEEPDSKNLRRGLLMEPVIADEYERETGRGLDNYIAPLYGTTGAAQLRGSPDRMIVGVTERSLTEVFREAGGVGVLEIKCQQTHMLRETKQIGLDPSYYAQVQHYLALTGLRWGSVACFNPEAWELYWFDVARDEEFIGEMHDELERWWVAHILTRQRPGARSETAVPVVRAPRVGATEVRLETPDWRRLAESARRAKAMKDEAEHLYEQVRTDIRTLMESLGHDVVRAPGMKASYPESTKRSFKKAALQRSGPLDRLKVMSVIASEMQRHGWAEDRYEEVLNRIGHECGVDFSEFEEVTAARTLTLTFEG